MRPWNPNTKSTGQPGDWTPPSGRPFRSVRTVWRTTTFVTKRFWSLYLPHRMEGVF